MSKDTGSSDCCSSSNYYPDEPDVMIMVKGKEFKYYGHDLCSHSGYFKKALQSSFHETTTKKFEFSDIEPDDWEVIMNLLRPFSKTKLTKQNVVSSLHLFDYFDIPVGINACDEFICFEMISKLLTEEITEQDPRTLTYSKFQNQQKKLNEVLEYYAEILECQQQHNNNFVHCPAKCLEILQRVFKDAHYLLDEMEIFKIISLMTLYDPVKNDLWPSLSEHLDPLLTRVLTADELLKRPDFAENLLERLSNSNPIQDLMDKWERNLHCLVIEPKVTRSRKRKMSETVK